MYTSSIPDFFTVHDANSAAKIEKPAAAKARTRHEPREWTSGSVTGRLYGRCERNVRFAVPRALYRVSERVGRDPQALRGTAEPLREVRRVPGRARAPVGRVADVVGRRRTPLC